MFRLLSVAVCLLVCSVVWGQGDNLLQELDRALDWNRFDVRSRSRFATQIFGDGALEKFDAESLRFSRSPRLGAIDDVSPEPQRGSVSIQTPRTTTQPAIVPVQPDIADPLSLPIRRPIGFYQRPGVLEPSTVFDEPPTATQREQRWFRESGVLRGGIPEGGAGLGAVGGEEPLRSAPETQVGTIRTPSTLALNPEQSRRRLEERLEGMLLSDPNVHLLSPVRFSFNGGIVTVRGVVPNQTHKVAVGNILLSDPAVRQVNNMISVVPLDPSRNPPPIEGR